MEKLKKFLSDEQDPDVVDKIFDKVKDLLTNGEEIEYIAVQKKLMVNISPDCVTLTNKRVIFSRPKNFGLSMEFQDYIWKDVSDCHMKEEIFGAEFSLKSIKGKISTIDYLPKVQARKLYQFAQEKEEEQREVRRQRELEEKRASSGAVTVTATMPNHNVSDGTTQYDPLASLQKLKTLLENGLISQQEYDTKKTEILSRL